MPKYFKTPHIVRWIFPRRVWSFSHNKDAVYLTFDDGPNGSLTGWILDTLREYEVKATFFCVGSNAKEQPELLERIKAEGHVIGNHTMNHELNSKVNSEDYLQSIREASNYIPSNLFRPPYGRLSMKDAVKIQKDYKIIMWSWLSYDYDQEVNIDEIMASAEKSIKGGDVLVLHDNAKASERLKELLPRLIQLIQNKKLRFEVISV